MAKKKSQARVAIVGGGTEVNVAIAGSGLAGLTAALRLSERGYKVTVYEKNEYIGGNFGARRYDGTHYYDVFVHMYANWYNNFRAIVEKDLGFEWKDRFESRTGIKFLSKKEFPHFKALTSSGYLLSGIEPPPDMFLWAYSLIDLLTQPFYPDDLLSRYSVNGIMQSRPYATNPSAALDEALVSMIWVADSSVFSARAYKNYINYGFRHPTPELWLMKEDTYSGFLKPLQDELLTRGCEIKTNLQVTQVTQNNGKVDTITLLDTTSLQTTEQKVDHLVLAVPPQSLWWLVMGFALPGGTAVEAGHRIADILPELAKLIVLKAAPIAVLYLYFKKKLPDIPKEPVGLRGSQYGLSFTAVSELRPVDAGMEDKTVLGLAASFSYALPGKNDDEWAYEMIKELNSYMPSFDPGKEWGDPKSDLDWEKSHFQLNVTETLFLNTIGSEQFGPEATYDKIPNLFFAGSFCKNFIDVATVEAAVVSGLNAAQALQSKTGLGDPIEIIEPDVYPESFLVTMKLLMTPYAYAAKWWSMILTPKDRDRLRQRVLGPDMTEVLWGPYTFAADWWETMWSLYSNMFPGGKKP